MLFRYQGQYEDSDIELSYNHFRYYDSTIGNYISQDTIGLIGSNPTLYGYVSDTNSIIDEFGLDLHHLIPNAVARDYKLNNRKVLGYVQDKNKKAKHNANLIKVETPFHGNHPAYSEYVT